MEKIDFVNRIFQMGYKDKWKYNQKYSSEVRKKGLLYIHIIEKVINGIFVK